MSKETQVSIRLSEELLRRAEAVARRMAKDPVTKHLRPTRTAVLRMALEKGLDALELGAEGR